MNAEIILNKNFLNWSRAILIGDSNPVTTIVSQSGGIQANAKLLIPLTSTSESSVYDIIGAHYWGPNYAYYYGNYSLNRFQNNNQVDISGNNAFYSVFNFGTGNATPTENDYVLAVDPTQPISEENPSTEIDYTNVTFSIYAQKKVEEGKAITSFSITIYNRKEETLNIKEVALSKRISTSSSATHTIIFGRGVLNETLSIAPSDMKTINIDLKM